ncbi:TPA: hypothetical protein OUI19_006015, partial [Pseudomonas aeruginosa]|nr:hypothetical protein [Pseudomonas aeruginosa]
ANQPQGGNAKASTPRYDTIVTWPDGWHGGEPIATMPLDKIFADGAVQPLLFC